MSAASDHIRVFVPTSLNELLQTFKAHPDAQVYAGGTHILSTRNTPYARLPEKVLSLHQVDELRRVTRTEKYIEFGAGVTLRRILDLGPKAFPAALFEAIQTLGPLGIENLATIGGNVCVSGRLMTLVPILYLLECRLELRSASGARWVRIGRFHDTNGTTVLEPGEILTRLRISPGHWNRQAFKSFGTIYLSETDPLVFCGLAHVDNSVLADFRFAITTHRPSFIRNQALEAELVGRKVPLAKRDYEVIEAGLAAVMDEQSIPRRTIQRRRAVRLTEWFAQQLR